MLRLKHTYLLLIFYMPLIFAFIFMPTDTYAQGGEKCIIQHNGKSGVCKLDNECLEAIEESKRLGIRPTSCGFSGSRQFICCENINNKRKRSISDEKCDEYSSHLKISVAAVPLSVTAVAVTHQITQCDYSSVPLIVGGQPAIIGEFPHMAALGYRENEKNRYICGGTLISDQYILTAAHCIRGDLPIEFARLGDTDTEVTEEALNPQDILISEQIKHPDYRPPSKENDIALLRLQYPVLFNKFIRPACLWTSSTIDRNKTVATGWGDTEFQSGQGSTILRKVVLDIIPKDRCSSHKVITATVKNQKKLLPHGIVDTMICAGDLEDKKDTCQGDSGGPIVVTDLNNSCLFHIIGITSFGKGCAFKSPAIYTRVSSYIPWIESIVWK